MYIHTQYYRSNLILSKTSLCLFLLYFYNNHIPLPFLPASDVFSFYLTYKLDKGKCRTMTVTVHDNPYCWNLHTHSTQRNKKEIHLRTRALTKKINSSLQLHLLCHYPYLPTLTGMETSNIFKVSFQPKKYYRNFLQNLLNQYLYFFCFCTSRYCSSHSTAFFNSFPKLRFLTCSYVLEETGRPTTPQALKNAWEFWTFPLS